MASYPVPIATTANLMIPKWVCGGVALWAGVGRAVEWYAKPVSQAAAELLVMEEETTEVESPAYSKP